MKPGKAIKNICGSREEVKIAMLTGVWKKVDSSSYGWLWGFKISVEEITADVVGNSMRIRIWSEAYRCDWIVAISYDKISSNELLLWMSEESGFLTWNPLVLKKLGEDCWNNMGFKILPKFKEAD